MKILIVGGVAGGAGAAARASRLDGNAEIIVFERGEYISFANCGLPYHVGNAIVHRESLMVMTPGKFKGRTGVDVRIRQEVMEINPERKEAKVRKLQTGEEYVESYDKLILATGASPVFPPVPGIDDPAVVSLWTIPDMDKIKERIDQGVKDAVIIGSGFIGVEAAENLVERDVNTTLVGRAPQILPFLDKEMAQPLAEELARKGVKLCLNNALTEITRSTENNKLTLALKDGTKLETELVIMSAGAKPNSELAISAKLELGERGGIKVNEYLQTSNPDIYAVGDVIEVNDFVLNKPAMFAFAGPANRQARIAANNIFGAKETYKGSLGTSICKVFDYDAASTGANEKRLKKENMEYLKTYVLPASHASYYPGAEQLCIKVLFETSGKILGAQIIGRDGVDKRIDIIATAIRNGLKTHDLEELELAYAPPYGSAKDPVNFVGFVAGNIIKGDSMVVAPDEIKEGSFLLDVREPDEVASGSIPGAKNIPLGKLRKNLDSLPKDNHIIVFCKVGLRGYLAERILRENGFDVRNMSGGYSVWKLFYSASPPPNRKK